jgi:hypothetical protein
VRTLRPPWAPAAPPPPSRSLSAGDADTDAARDLARRWFSAPPRTWTWVQPIAYWAQVSAKVGEPDPAWLHGQLLSHTGELALVGIGADCGGSVDSLLAGLALRLGRPDEALERARAGLALEHRAGARVWIPRTSALIEEATRALAEP